MGPAGEAGKWIVHEPKVQVASSTCGSDFREQLTIKRHRLEQQHSEITQTRNQGIVAAEKQRHAKPSLALKRKPIAVRASHGINFFHTESFINFLSSHKRRDRTHAADL
jgi:hypothetical protein